MPFQFLLHPSRTSLNRKRHSNLRFAPRLSWLSHFSRPALSTFAPHLPRLPAFLDSPSVPFDSRPTFPTSDLHAPRLSRPSRFPLAENANRGPDCKENVPVWQKTSLGGLIRQGNAEAARLYRERLSPAKKKNRRSENRPSRIAPRLPKSEPRNEAP